MSVTRYGINAQGVFTNMTDGGYVSYQDFEKLAAENAGLNKYITQSCYVFDGEQHEISDAYICATDGGIPETPATDAFLAEVRAQGVEMLHAVFNQAGCVGSPELHSAMNTFMLNIASKVRSGEFAVDRKGVQS